MSDTDLHVGYTITNSVKARTYINKYIGYFLEVSLQDNIFNNFLPSLVAASVLAASRTCIKITPTWTGILVQKTGYNFSDLEDCVSKLMEIHAADEIRANQSVK